MSSSSSSISEVSSAVVPLLEGAVRRLSGGTLGVLNMWGIGLVPTIIAFYVVGLMCSAKLGAGIIASLTNAMSRIPVIRSLLEATRQATLQFHFSRAGLHRMAQRGHGGLGIRSAAWSMPPSLLPCNDYRLITLTSPLETNRPHAIVAENCILLIPRAPEAVVLFRVAIHWTPISQTTCLV